jgi:hypothetical protein
MDDSPLVVKYCGNGKIKRKVKKTANEDVTEIVWEWFVSVRAKKIRYRNVGLRQVQHSHNAEFLIQNS